MFKQLSSLFLSLICWQSAQAELQMMLGAKALVPGESMQILLLEDSGESVALAEMPTVKNGTLKLEQQGFMPYANSPTGQAPVYLFTYIPDKAGKQEIPSFSVRSASGKISKTLPQLIDVLPFDVIEWKEVALGEETATYGTFWYLPSPNPYANQAQEAELKIYASPQLSNFNLPQIQSEGFVASRFLPTLPLQNSVQPTGEALLKSKTWAAYTYTGTLSALKSGKITLGGTLDTTVIREQVNPTWGSIYREYVPLPLALASKTMEALPLPPNPPAGFKNAVGDFQIRVSTQARDITEGEPISVSLTITGKGNLNVLTCPNPENEENWKLYPPNKTKSSEGLSGAIEYQLLMKPISPTDALPSFKLVYFNPTTKSYQITSSPPIPLQWKASSAPLAQASSPVALPPPAGIVPTEEMTDVLGLVPTPIPLPETTTARAISFSVVGIIFAFFIGLGIQRRRAAWKHKHRHELQKVAQLEAIEDFNSSQDFLKALGNFIESYIPKEQRNEAVSHILEERDLHNFNPAAPQTPLSKEEKKHLIHTVKKALTQSVLLLLATFFFFTPTLFAKDSLETANRETAIPLSLEESYQKGDFKAAKEALSPLSAQSSLEDKARYYYTLGNIEYKLGNSGLAALAYRRSLSLAPDFYEARRNLSFIERKEGVITPDRSSWEHKIEWIASSTLEKIFLGSLLGLLLLGALAWSVQKYPLWGKIVFSTLLFLCLCSFWMKKNYPHSDMNLSPSQQFIITQKDSSAWHDASQNSKKVYSKLPAGTWCHLLALRGDWCYVELPNKTRAWVLTQSGEVLSI